MIPDFSPHCISLHVGRAKEGEGDRQDCQHCPTVLFLGMVQHVSGYSDSVSILSVINFDTMALFLDVVYGGYSSSLFILPAFCRLISITGEPMEPHEFRPPTRL